MDAINKRTLRRMNKLYRAHIAHPVLHARTAALGANGFFAYLLASQRAVAIARVATAADNVVNAHWPVLTPAHIAAFNAA